MPMSKYDAALDYYDTGERRENPMVSSTAATVRIPLARGLIGPVGRDPAKMSREQSSSTPAIELTWSTIATESYPHPAPATGW